MVREARFDGSRKSLITREILLAIGGRLGIEMTG